MRYLLVLTFLLLSSTVAGTEWDDIHEECKRDTLKTRHDIAKVIDFGPHPCTDSLLTIDTVGFEKRTVPVDCPGYPYGPSGSSCLVAHYGKRWRPVLCSTYVSYVVKDTVGWERCCLDFKVMDQYSLEELNRGWLADTARTWHIEKRCSWVPIVKKRVCGQ